MFFKSSPLLCDVEFNENNIIWKEQNIKFATLKLNPDYPFSDLEIIRIIIDSYVDSCVDFYFLSNEEKSVICNDCIDKIISTLEELGHFYMVNLIKNY